MLNRKGKVKVLVSIWVAVAAVVAFTIKGVLSSLEPSSVTEPEKKVTKVDSSMSQEVVESEGEVEGLPSALTSRPNFLVPSKKIPEQKTYPHLDPIKDAEKLEGLPADMVEALTNPNPELPDDFKKQLRAAPRTLPQEMQAQLDAPPAPLPEAMQAQLDAPVERSITPTDLPTN